MKNSGVNTFRQNSARALIHKSSLIGAGLINIRYTPVATKFRAAAK
jgi:hypothetical protein